jgi:hypothetical protein
MEVGLWEEHLFWIQLTDEELAWTEATIQTGEAEIGVGGIAMAQAGHSVG